MSDDLTKRHPQDGEKINTSQDWELQQWSKELGSSPDRLRNAVKQVGPSVDAVKKFLKGGR